MKSEKGQAAVEFALVLPILFILIFGIVDFGRFLYTKSALTSICQQTARYVSINPSLTANQINDFADSIAQGKLDPGDIMLVLPEGGIENIKVTVGTGTDTTDAAKVTLSYNITYITPMRGLIKTFLNSDLTAIDQVTSTAIFRME